MCRRRARRARPATATRSPTMTMSRCSIFFQAEDGILYESVTGVQTCALPIFGSKQGLVAAVGREVAQSITTEVLGGLEEHETAEQVIRGLLDGLWRILDRDERLARLYFDLAAVSVVEPEVRATMQEMKAYWRQVVGGLLDGSEAASVYVIAGI